MFRIRNAVPLSGHTPPGIHPSPSRRAALTRYAAMVLLGLVLGASGTALTVTLVRAGDDAGVRAFHLQEAARRAPIAAALTYAPVSSGWRLPLFGSYPDGRIEHPPVLRERGKPRDGATVSTLRATARYDTGSGASRT